ncbi:MAG: hypothetical protein WD075_08580 [Rhodospirillales bacterium]
MSSKIYFVHCIDTEGPLYESLDAKFQLLKEVFNIDGLPVSWDNFAKLQAGKLDIGGKEREVAEFFNSQRVNLNRTWTEVEAMLDRITAPEFRNSRPDSNGNGWVYNWFCLDHINYQYNPRRRDIGFHNVFDFYADYLQRTEGYGDALHWHFHPMSTYSDAHRCATHYFRSPEIFEILCRKIIERNWFPSTYRAGFNLERPDSHWFLEQWIPFDISNSSQEDNTLLENSLDLRNGRAGDWRRALKEWSIYHPDHDDYQRPGNCRRWIGRALHLLNRLYSLTENEVVRAFEQAAAGKPALVGLCSHDFRDMGAEVEYVRDLIDKVSPSYPGVTYEFAEARHAFRQVIGSESDAAPALDFDLTFNPADDNDHASIDVTLKQGSVFGPQPFLAIETKSRRFIHDNFDFTDFGTRWSYAFYGDTLPIDDVARIGVAANDKFGNTCIRHLDFT